MYILIAVHTEDLYAAPGTMVRHWICYNFCFVKSKSVCIWVCAMFKNNIVEVLLGVISVHLLSPCQILACLCTIMCSSLPHSVFVYLYIYINICNRSLRISQWTLSHWHGSSYHLQVLIKLLLAVGEWYRIYYIGQCLPWSFPRASVACLAKQKLCSTY